MKKRGTGICPVLTERTGEPTGHIMIPGRVYCDKCPTEKSAYESRRFCAGEHVTFRYCPSCDEFRQLDWHPCDQIVARYHGNWPSYSYCDKKAVEQRNEYSDLLEKRKRGKRWLCRQHFPENIDAHTIERNRRSAAKYDAETEKRRYGWVGHGYEDILLEMAGWMAANTELVAEDEWLGKISRMMADNGQLMKMLGTEETS